MTNPGGPYWQEQHPQYQVDPITGRPLQPGQQAGQQPGYQQPGYQQPGYQQPGYQQPGYQQPGYGGLGGYQMPPPGPPRRNHLPWILGLVAIVVVGGVTATLLLINKDDKPTNAAGSPTSERPAPTTTIETTTPPPTTDTTPLSPEDIQTDPVIPGWQGVLSPRDKAAYDTPPDWQVESPGTIVGFEDNEGKPVALMHGVATYKPDACPDSPGSYRGHVGFVTADDLDPKKAAPGAAKLFADAAALNEDGTKARVTVSAPTPVKVAQNSIDAVRASATLTNDKPDGCDAPSIEFTAIAFKTGGQTGLFMMYMDQGTADALPADVAEQVISSVRPAE
jgi:hypothetical protein